MSTMQRVTLIGLYNYENSFGRDLFRNLTLPNGIDKTTFVKSLLLEHGEKCVLYNNPDFFVNAIGTWSDKYALEISRIYEALTAEYNPIWNYDRYEKITDNEGRKYESEMNAGHKATDSPDYDVVTESNNDAVTEEQISADNSNDYQPEHKTIVDGGKSTTTTSGKTQDIAETSNSKTKDSETHNFTHDGHLYGNIGVTTSASMVTEVVQQRFTMTLYGTLTKMFANELLIGIY